MIACSISIAQVDYNTYYGEIMLGQVVKHRDGLLYDVPPLSMMIQGGQVVQTYGLKPWHAYWGYPRLERSIHIHRFGDDDVLGYAIGAAPGIAFYLKRYRTSSILLHLHAGFAYLTKEYNAATNPTNNAIGSNFNNTTQLKVSYERELSSQLMMDIGLGVTHYSNGLSSSPNSGINVFGLHMGIKPTLANNIKTEGLSFDLEIEPDQFKKFGINIFTSYGLAEYVVPGGPKYPVKNYSAGVYYQPSMFLRWHMGVDYDYDFSAYEFSIRDFQSEDVSTGDATTTAAYAAIEGIFGDITFRYQMGYYLPLLYEVNETVPYSKFIIAYHLPYDLYGVRPYAGILLKTHVAVADYVALQFGLHW